MNTKYIFLTIFSFLLNYSNAQEIIPPSDIKWYSLNEAVELAKDEPRPIIIDVYTEWCSWCNYMMKTTYANKGISDYINSHFYAAKLNAETTDTIIFKGNKYFNRMIGQRPTHDLASILLEGKLTYPSVIFFDITGNKTVVSGYKEPKDIEPYLVYFAENLSKAIDLDDFVVNFMFSFPEAFKKDHSIFKIDNSLKPDTLGEIDWVSPEKIMHLNKKKPKPVLMYFYTDACISCKVMERTSFGNNELAQKLNENYLSVKVNATDSSQITFLGKVYPSSGAHQIHQISQQFLNQNFQMPAVVIFDENYTVIARINGYLKKEQILPLTEYFYNKSFKKLSFQEYLKTYVTVKQQTVEKSIN